MNIYLWVASDRCWGEDSRILQFDGGNNLNRLMRNILPQCCLPCTTATWCLGANIAFLHPRAQSSPSSGVQRSGGVRPHPKWRCGVGKGSLAAQSSKVHPWLGQDGIGECGHWGVHGVSPFPAPGHELCSSVRPHAAIPFSQHCVQSPKDSVLL